MSIIKSIKQVLGLGPAAENHFFDGSVPNQLSLRRGTPEAPGTELIKALNGILSFPNQGQSLGANGYVKLPGGLIVQWGFIAGGGGDRQITYPIPFPTIAVALTLVCGEAVSTTGAVVATGVRNSTSGFGFYPRFVNTGGGVGVATQSFDYIAIGY